jgi:hypothetical protein
LLQRWFSLTQHRLAHDPYFLYAASNAGSLVALVGYPAVMEPLLRLSMQRTLWTGGYALLFLLIVACALAASRHRGIAPSSSRDPGDLPGPLGLRDRSHWIALAAVPSSLMLGVTTHLTSDISPIPLLWVLPLALYVTSFIFVFARRPPLPHWLAVRAMPIVLLPLVVVVLKGGTDPSTRWLDVGLPFGLGGLAALLGRVTPAQGSVMATLVVLGVPAIACFAFRRHPLRFALGVAMLFLVVPRALHDEATTDVYHDRSFFGVYRVADIQDNRLRALYHGTTIHGAQTKDGPNRLEPLLYFHRGGPAASIFAAITTPSTASGVAIIGLGTGSLACYAVPGQPVTFYEIDPVVLKIARDARLFTFLRDCSSSTTVVLGDGRLSIAAAADKSYRLVIVDAFSSDAIPMHLLTREAIALYMAKLTDDGILGLHISNRYLELRPVVAALARDLGLVAFGRDDADIGPAERAQGRVGSQWAVIARRPSAPTHMVGDPRWERLVVSTNIRAWTDDFSNIVTLVRWR